jgi:hypothetical protein
MSGFVLGNGYEIFWSKIFVVWMENMNNSDRMGNRNVRMYDKCMKIRNVCWIVIGCYKMDK